jgi:hypothetical protein
VPGAGRRESRRVVRRGRGDRLARSVVRCLDRARVFLGLATSPDGRAIVGGLQLAAQSSGWENEPGYRPLGRAHGPRAAAGPYLYASSVRGVNFLCCREEVRLRRTPGREPPGVGPWLRANRVQVDAKGADHEGRSSHRHQPAPDRPFAAPIPVPGWPSMPRPNWLTCIATEWRATPQEHQGSGLHHCGSGPAGSSPASCRHWRSLRSARRSPASRRGRSSAG